MGSPGTSAVVPLKKRVPRVSTREAGGPPGGPGTRGKDSEGEMEKNKKKNSKAAQVYFTSNLMSPIGCYRAALSELDYA